MWFPVRVVAFVFVFGCMLLPCPVTEATMKLDGNTFLISNKKYHHAKLAMFGTRGGRDMGTYEGEIAVDQFWQLKEDTNHPGYYYIYNLKYNGYRVAKWGREDKEVGVYNGQYYNDQLWKFDNVYGDFYRIYNLYYHNARITKFGKADADWGTYNGKIYEDQSWKLVPRFKAKVKNVTIWSCDNRQGSEPFSEEITVTTGIRLTSSESISTTVGLEASLKASVSVAPVSSRMKTELSRQIQTFLSSSEEKTWSRTSKKTFIAPKGKNYRVKQLTCEFASRLESDNCALTCHYIIEKTEGEFYD